MKKFFHIIALLLIGFSLQANDIEGLTEDDEEFEALFLESNDTEATSTKPNDTFYRIPLSLSGSFYGDVGGLYSYDHMDKESSGGLFFTFKNYLYMNARPGREFSIHGSVYTGLTNQFNFEINDIYFDYLLLDHIYITGGKKGTSWGYIRLFSNDSVYKAPNETSSENEYGKKFSGELYTNILSDSSSFISAMVRVPWSSGVASVGGLIPKSECNNANIGFKSLSYVGSLEQTIFHQTFNFFFRKYGDYENKKRTFNTPEELNRYYANNRLRYEIDSNASGKISVEEKKNPVFGIETKRTIGVTDIYAQGLVRVFDFNKLNSTDGYEKFIFTGGFYNLWDSFTPNFGINSEYQLIHDYGDNSDNHLMAFEAGVKKLGHNKNIKFGLNVNENFTQRTGNATLVMLVSGLFPFADWKNAVDVYYGKNFSNPKVTIASTLYLSVGY